MPLKHLALNSESGENKNLIEILESLDAIVWVADAKTFQMIYVSRKAEDILGYPCSDWINDINFWANNILPEDREEAVRFCQEQTAKMLSHRFEYRMRARDGRIVWMEDIVTVKAENGEPTLLRGVMIDITKRKEIEEQIDHNKELLRVAQKLGKIGSWEWDTCSDKLSCSEELYNIFGLCPETFDGNGAAALNTVYPDDVEIVLAAVIKGRTTGIIEPLDFRIKHKNGSLRYIHGEAKIVRAIDGKIVKVVGSFQDISDRKKNELRMIESSKLIALGEMAAGMAHEINNPLTIILSRAYLLKEKVKNKEFEQNQTLIDLEKIENASERISRIVKSLKQFSGAPSEFLECIDIGAIISQAVGVLENKLQNIQMKFNLNQLEDSKVECQSHLLVQLLVHLLNNSIFALKNVDEKWIEISLSKKDNSIEISVLDSGSGVDTKIVNKIMQPFFTTKDVGEGMGMGLSISKGIAEGHNGKIYYDSESKNTRFVVELPTVN